MKRHRAHQPEELANTIRLKFLKKRERKTWNWEVGVMLEELGDKKEYDQNIFYEILKEYMTIF